MNIQYFIVCIESKTSFCCCCCCDAKQEKKSKHEKESGHRFFFCLLINHHEPFIEQINRIKKQKIQIFIYEEIKDHWISGREKKEENSSSSDQFGYFFSRKFVMMTISVGIKTISVSNNHHHQKKLLLNSKLSNKNRLYFYRIIIIIIITIIIDKEVVYKIKFLKKNSLLETFESIFFSFCLKLK